MTFFLNHPAKSALRPRLLLAGLLGMALLVLPTPELAQAGVFDFLVGGRENRGGRASNRQQGGGVRSGRLVGGFDATVPYIITPRNTFQTSDQFTIRWNPVAGAERYTVRLWQWQDANGGRERVVWETTTPESSVLYEGDPPLAPELFYSVEVITDQGVSSDSDAGCAIAGFAVLFPETRSRLEADLASLNDLTLSPEEQALATAQIYLAYQMLNAAIDSLAAQAALVPTATLALALGDLYSFAGLNSLAAEQYTLALELAGDDNLWQAIALEGLGELEVVQNNLAAALPQLRQAQLSYALANNSTRANQLKRRIELLEKAQQLNIAPTDTPDLCTAPIQ
ncbi:MULTISPECIES: tetratricopeptide repeat protein [Cyanophyceae]|uniref:Tetratricopeptide repeat protein n=1 Tax=Leptolyngbya subtilissima DQ-A4 TaxID=2933933 RepID=A0ABV0K3A5_9CYAN|nr:tetratricopeptide repeat protein [Nodosilinea sp. FACHB-141]MBD2113161.1 hypothetical protein [Nodosilinea sp. FACHB-141]